MPTTAEALTISLGLAPGYLALRLYMIDADWKSLSPIDVTLGSLAFSASSYIFFWILGSTEQYTIKGQYFSKETLNVFSLHFITTIIMGLCWRHLGHPLLHFVLRKIGSTNEDNMFDPWLKIFGDPRLYVRQITVYLKNGDALMCDDTLAYDTAKKRALGLFPYYTHRNGQLSFVPTHRKPSGSREWQPVVDIEASASWGTRVVLVNASEIQRLEVRLADSSAVPMISA